MDDSPMEDAVSPAETSQATPPSTSGSKSEPIPQALSPIDQQRMSLWILTQKDRPIASFESMKEFLELPDEISIKMRVDELNERYEEDLNRLYMAQAEDYLNDADDLYNLYNSLEEPDGIETLYSGEEWDYILAHTTSTYNLRLADLTKTLETVAFPQSVDDFRSKSKDIQHRVARFLLLESDDEKEKMLSDFNWAWRQVTPLSDEFQQNTEFQEQIRAVLNTQEGVDTDPKVAIGDPRKR
ncbi:hypothetical protein DFH07DRAFT_79556 [Mycena maculata]|uniref:Uncharacterized protein n=1 Tax=Mycena maculata TaxID=230809 RepID=A0AAD7IB08_9AGAR|nr:hypothetical protein DFH07DRAFT_79556 [Mycena maculata]